MPKLDEQRKDVLLHKLAELAAEANGQTGTSKKASMSLEDKERVVNSLLSDPTGRGLKRVAYAKHTVLAY
jgi:hypothetical protein